MIMWRDTRITELFGIQHPVVQAPMAGSTTPELVAAVGAAGGLGSLGCGMTDTAGVEDLIKDLRRRSNAPSM